MGFGSARLSSEAIFCGVLHYAARGFCSFRPLHRASEPDCIIQRRPSPRGCAWILLNNCWLLGWGRWGFVFITSRLKHHRNGAQTLANNWISTFVQRPTQTCDPANVNGTAAVRSLHFNLPARTRRTGWNGSGALETSFIPLTSWRRNRRGGSCRISLPQHSFHCRSQFLLKYAQTFSSTN